MRRVHCDGCGFTEPGDKPRGQRKIKDVTLDITNDPRFPEGTAKHTADLCPACVDTLLHSYFNVPLENRLELADVKFSVPDELELEMNV
jgi:hypothetical protein